MLCCVVGVGHHQLTAVEDHEAGPQKGDTGREAARILIKEHCGMMMTLIIVEHLWLGFEFASMTNGDHRVLPWKRG